MNRHLEREIRENLFVWIEPDRAKYYQSDSLLSQGAASAFPSSFVEIKEAGNCYATDRNTGCVLHAMRSLEKPFYALAAALPLTLSKDVEVLTWGQIYSAIETKVNDLRKTIHTKQRDKELAFYSQANKEFGYFKDAWRNFVAHGREFYDSPQAASVMQHTIAFIERLVLEGLRE